MQGGEDASSSAHCWSSLHATNKYFRVESNNSSKMQSQSSRTDVRRRRARQRHCTYYVLSKRLACLLLNTLNNVRIVNNSGMYGMITCMRECFGHEAFEGRLSPCFAWRGLPGRTPCTLDARRLVYCAGPFTGSRGVRSHGFLGVSRIAYSYKMCIPGIYCSSSPTSFD